MSGPALAAILVAVFMLAIGLVRVLGWMIDRYPDEELAEKPKER